MRYRLYYLPLLMVLLFASVIPAETRTDFSGAWVMNSEASDFGALPAPAKYVREITHSDPDLKIVTTQSSRQGIRTSEISYTTDGQECTNVVRGNETRGTATWDGTTLVIQSSAAVRGTTVTVDENWEMSEDGQTLTVDVQLGSPRGAATIKIVLNKANDQ